MGGEFKKYLFNRLRRALQGGGTEGIGMVGTISCI